MKPIRPRRPLEELPTSKSSNQSKTVCHTRESSITSIPSSVSSSHNRTSSSYQASASKPGHRRTASTLTPYLAPSIQQAISSTVDQLQEKLTNEKQKLEHQKQKLKSMLIQAISNEKKDENSKPAAKKCKTSEIEQIVKYFFPNLEKTAGLTSLFTSKLSTFFVAIKNKSFAVFSKDSGTWQRIYGDESIKVTKSTSGVKVNYHKNSITKTKSGQQYNVFILK